jgi:hypothetical protein
MISERLGSASSAFWRASRKKEKRIDNVDIDSYRHRYGMDG